MSTQVHTGIVPSAGATPEGRSGNTLGRMTCLTLFTPIRSQWNPVVKLALLCVFATHLAKRWGLIGILVVQAITLAGYWIQRFGKTAAWSAPRAQEPDKKVGEQRGDWNGQNPGPDHALDDGPLNGVEPARGANAHNRR